MNIVFTTMQEQATAELDRLFDSFAAARDSWSKAEKDSVAEKGLWQLGVERNAAYVAAGQAYAAIGLNNLGRHGNFQKESN